MTYHPEGGSEFSLQLSDPAATEATLTDLQCNTNYTITVVATAGEHRRKSVTLQGELYTVMHVEVCTFLMDVLTTQVQHLCVWRIQVNSIVSAAGNDKFSL